MHPVFDLLSEEDRVTALMLLGELRDPDLVIAPDALPYLYRWHLIPQSDRLGNDYFHIQVRSDPERPLHDHPWDNMSVILSGGYHEVLAKSTLMNRAGIYSRSKGNVIFREAHWAHRLTLPEGVPYTMTRFTTGPKVREWGFWCPDGWVSSKKLVRERDGISVWRNNDEL